MLETGRVLIGLDLRTSIYFRYSIVIL